MPENGTGGMARRPIYWTIAGESRSATLTVDPDDGGEALAVFSFQEEADLFLRFQGARGDWRVRETTAGEIVSVLRGSHASVERIVMDPLPQGICTRTGIAQLIRKKDDFSRLLAGTTGTAPGSLSAPSSLHR